MTLSLENIVFINFLSFKGWKMKKIEKLAEMIEDDPLSVAEICCPSEYGMEDCDIKHCFKDKKSCYRCWMEEVKE